MDIFIGIIGGRPRGRGISCGKGAVVCCFGVQLGVFHSQTCVSRSFGSGRARSLGRSVSGRDLYLAGGGGEMSQRDI